MDIPEPYLQAHLHSVKNKEELEASKIVGCFYCSKMFPPNEITEWTDQGQTALCPKCGVDSLLSDSFPLTAYFLEKMYDYWFGNEIPLGGVLPHYKRLVPSKD